MRRMTYTQRQRPAGRLDVISVAPGVSSLVINVIINVTDAGIDVIINVIAPAIGVIINVIVAAIGVIINVIGVTDIQRMVRMRRMTTLTLRL